MSRFGIVALSLGGVALIGTAIYFVTRRKHHGRGKRNRPRMIGQTKAGDMTLSHYFDKDMPIQQRAGLLQDSVWKNVQNPQLRELALAITGCGKRNVTVGKYTIAVDGACCRARDGRCEARAIYDWTKNNVRYTGDVAPVKMGRNGEVEGIDLFQGPLRTVEFGGGDCDDHAVLNSTLLILNGIPSNFRITSPRRFEDWAHIYSTAGLPKTDPDHWVALDTTVPGDFFGKEAPSAKQIDFTA